MTTPALPTSGSTSWYSWATAVDNNALRGGLAATFANKNLTLYAEDYRPTGGTDTQMLNAAMAAVTSGATLRFKPGSALSVTSGLSYSLSGMSDIVIDFAGSTMTASGTGQVLKFIGGRLNNLTTVTADIAKRSSTITVASAASLAVGDLILIQSNPGTGLYGETFNPDRPDADWKGELAYIAGISGTTVTLESPTYDSYSTNPLYTVNVSKYTPVKNLTVKGLRVIGSGTGGTQSALSFNYFDGVTVENCHAVSTELEGIVGATGVNFNVSECTATLVNQTGVGYGFHATAVDGVHWSRCTGRKNRHSFDIGTGPSPTRNFTYTDLTAIDDDSAGISTHTSERGVIKGCIVRDCGGGIIVRGSHTEVCNFKILGTKTNVESSQTYLNGITVGDDGSHPWGLGIAGIGINIHDGEIDLTNPRQVTDSSPAIGIYVTAKMVGARIDYNSISGHGSHGVYAKGDGALLAEINNNNIDCSAQIGTAGTTQTYGVYLNPAHAVTGNILKRIRVRDNTIDNPLYAGVFVAGNVDNAAVSDGIDVRDNEIAGYGKYGVQIDAGYYGKDVRVRDNKFPDAGATLATVVHIAAAAQYARYPKISGNDIALNGVTAIHTGNQQGAKLRVANWYGSDGYGSGSTGSMVVGSMTATPIYVSRVVTLSAIGVNVSTGGGAGALIRLGIYADLDDGIGGYPGALVIDAGTADASATAFISAAVSVTLQPGLYWLAAVSQAGSPICSALQGPNPVVGYQGTGGLLARNAYRQLSVTAALPSTYSTSVDAQGSPPQVQIKISA